MALFNFFIAIIFEFDFLVHMIQEVEEKLSRGHRVIFTILVRTLENFNDIGCNFIFHFFPKFIPTFVVIYDTFDVYYHTQAQADIYESKT